MKVNGNITNPGELSSRIVLARRADSTDTGGFVTKGLAFVAQLWARWTNAHGSEALVANANGLVEPATVLVRYRDDIDATCLVVKGASLTPIKNEHDVVTGYQISGGKIYEIISLDDIGERHEYIELKLKRMAAG